MKSSFSGEISGTIEDPAQFDALIEKLAPTPVAVTVSWNQRNIRGWHSKKRRQREKARELKRRNIYNSTTVDSSEVSWDVQ